MKIARPDSPAVSRASYYANPIAFAAAIALGSLWVVVDPQPGPDASYVVHRFAIAGLVTFAVAVVLRLVVGQQPNACTFYDDWEASRTIARYRWLVRLDQKARADEYWATVDRCNRDGVDTTSLHGAVDELIKTCKAGSASGRMAADLEAHVRGVMDELEEPES